MAAMQRTTTPGIYKRGSRYVVRYRAGGKQRQESTRTLKDALRLKRAREADRDRGEFEAESRMPFREYAQEWVERYHGHGRGFTENTRDEYRRDLQRYAFPFLSDRKDRTVSGISPKDIADWIGWLCNGREQERQLADATVKRIIAPVRSCLASAKREGLRGNNPVDGAALPDNPKIEDEDEYEVRALTREELRTFLGIVRPDHRLLFRFVSATGLRWSELIELRWKDFRLDGARPHVRVRRARVKGRLKPPKSKHGRRDVPLDAGIVFELRRRRAEAEWGGDEDLTFPSATGAGLDHSNIRRRVLKPAAEEAGVPWIGFHAFRHTCASMPTRTCSTMVSGSDDGLGEALDLNLELERANTVRTDGAESDRTGPDSLILQSAI